MDGSKIILEWSRDALGYRLLKPAPRVSLAALSRGEIVLDVTLPESLRAVDRGETDRICRQGGTLIPYRPTDALDFIFREFVNTPPNSVGVLSFVSRFGMLRYSGPDQQHEEPVSTTITNIEIMNSVIDKISAGKAANKAFFEGMPLQPDGLVLSDLKARLTFDEVSGAPKVTYATLSLMAALWLYFGQLLENETTVLRRCLQCNALFDAGVGSGRRKDSKFCTDAHRTLFHNQRLSERRIEALDQTRSRKRPRRATS
jgi:hypothetical protein